MEKHNIINLDPQKLISYLEKTGYEFNSINSKILYQIENIYKKNGKNRLEIAKEFKLDKNIIEMIEIFSILDRYNINYINYIIIMNSINTRILFNLYRFIMVKWNKAITKLNKNYEKTQDKMKAINNFRFSPIKNIEDDKLFEEILRRFKNFVFLDGGKFPNIYILFLVNNIQEYLCPN